MVLKPEVVEVSEQLPAPEDKVAVQEMLPSPIWTEPVGVPPPEVGSTSTETV